MSPISPVQDTFRGIKTYLEGFRWLRNHPKYLALLTLPALMGLLFMIGGVSLFATYDDVIFAKLLFSKPESWYMLLVYYVCKVLLSIAIVALSFLASLLLSNIVASPIYETVSLAIEMDVTGQRPPSLSLAESLRVIIAELKKVCFILLIFIILLLIPGLNVISTLFAAFLAGWDAFDYPLVRRGWTFQQRLAFVGGEFWSVLGLGLWLVIPFAQIFLLPLAIAGGTLLNLEALKRKQLLTPYVPSREDP